MLVASSYRTNEDSLHFKNVGGWITALYILWVWMCC